MPRPRVPSLRWRISLAAGLVASLVVTTLTVGALATLRGRVESEMRARIRSAESAAVARADAEPAAGTPIPTAPAGPVATDPPLASADAAFNSSPNAPLRSFDGQVRLM